MQSLRTIGFVGALLFSAVATMALPAGGVAQDSGASLTVSLEEYDGSGVTGTAVLTETTAGGTNVSLELQGQTLDGNHPTHIHTGTCDDFDPNPLYPLETINLSPVDQAGVSETEVEAVSLDTLRDGDYVILVHQSPEELTTYLVCGEVGSGTVGVAEVTAATGDAAEMHQMPEAGVGTGVAIDSSVRSAAALSALAIVSLIGAIALRWSRR